MKNKLIAYVLLNAMTIMLICGCGKKSDDTERVASSETESELNSQTETESEPDTETEATETEVTEKETSDKSEDSKKDNKLHTDSLDTIYKFKAGNIVISPGMLMKDVYQIGKGKELTFVCDHSLSEKVKAKQEVTISAITPSDDTIAFYFTAYNASKKTCLLEDCILTGLSTEASTDKGTYFDKLKSEDFMGMYEDDLKKLRNTYLKKWKMACETDADFPNYYIYTKKTVHVDAIDKDIKVTFIYYFKVDTLGLDNSGVYSFTQWFKTEPLDVEHMDIIY